jgi:hypothetical protein
LTDECIDIGQFDDVLRLPDGDPRRRHLETCPKCSSQLALYRQFTAAEAIGGAKPEEADARLAEVMRKAIYEGSAAADDRSRSGFFARFFGAIVTKPAWGAVAAALLLAVAVAWWQPWTTEQPVLRGSDTSPAGLLRVQLVRPDTLADGSLRLAWNSLENAENYVVRIRNLELEEIATFGPVSDTTLVVRRSMLPKDAPSIVLWRVVAMHDGDEIGRSRPASLEFP